ncbi:hypothetical protein D4764_14G0004900 [Takifugu flavidus]|uniref:Uncharacterized protein n=1 Tax=Takifugu flavidus TaxID=433684 RepID=A0A5C6P8I2_9TELE|nr:hypothetical protein D4764_14G0004900 [Takifugu flavidus]
MKDKGGKTGRLEDPAAGTDTSDCESMLDCSELSGTVPDGQHVVALAGPDLTGAEVVGSLLGIRSTQAAEGVLRLWRNRLSMRERHLLEDYGQGTEPDSEEPFLEIRLAAYLGNLDGPLLRPAKTFSLSVFIVEQPGAERLLPLEVVLGSNFPDVKADVEALELTAPPHPSRILGSRPHNSVLGHPQLPNQLPLRPPRWSTLLSGSSFILCTA